MYLLLYLVISYFEVFFVETIYPIELDIYR